MSAQKLFSPGGLIVFLAATLLYMVGPLFACH